MIFAIVSILALSAICGKFCVRMMEKRERFYSELENLCLFFKNEIQFLNTKNAVLFDKFFDAYCVSDVQLFKEMKVLAGGEMSVAFEKTLYLKKNEKQKIKEFLQNFGKSDQFAMIACIENFLQWTKMLHEESLTKRKQNAPLCYKVCLAIGSALCVLIL